MTSIFCVYCGVRLVSSVDGQRWVAGDADSPWCDSRTADLSGTSLDHVPGAFTESKPGRPTKEKAAALLQLDNE